MNRRYMLIPTLTVALAWAHAGFAQSVTGWRGAGAGRYPDANPVPNWSPTKNVVWKASLPGASPASPILVKDRLFVLSDPSQLFCVRASDGEVLWKRGHTAADLGDGKGAKVTGNTPNHNPDGEAGSAASTPTSDGRYVFAMFANGVVSCHDLDGRQQWVQFIEKPKMAFGHASSPLLIGGKLIVHFVDFVALDAGTGKEIWRVKLPASHASPVAARIGGMDVIIHPAGSILRTTDGKVLTENLFRVTQSSPVVHEGIIYAHEKGSLKAFALPRRTGETLNVKLLWETATPRGQYQVATPVVHDGTVYTVSLNGIWQVTDANTGRIVYKRRLPFSSRVYVSVHFAGGKLFVTDQTGKTVVLRPGRAYKELAVNDLDYHPTGAVFSGRRQYVRTHQKLFCIGE